MNPKCIFGMHLYHETGFRKGSFYYEVVCERCGCLNWLHLVHNCKELVEIRERDKRTPVEL